MPSPGGYSGWSVQIKGGTEMRKALRGVGDGLADLKMIHLQVAQTVAIAARQNAPRKTGRLIASIKPKATQGSARVEGGGGGVPWFAVREFGGGIRWKPKGKFARWAGGQVVRSRGHYIPAQPHSGEGYILFKAAREKREQVKEKYLDGVRKLLAKHGIGTMS